MKGLEHSAIENTHQELEGDPQPPPSLGRQVTNWIKLSQSRWMILSGSGFPFSVGPHATPVARFRAVARRTRFAKKSLVLRGLAYVAMTLAWPYGAFVAALRARAKMRKEGRWPGGMRMFVDMYWLALRHSIPPREYAIYRLDQPKQRKDLDQYIYRDDVPGLAVLNSRLGADNRDVQDKYRFSEICSRRRLPHVPTLAVYDQGRQFYPATPFVADAPTLWVKALRLNGGAGAAKWTRDGEAYRNARGRRVISTKLAHEFSKQDCLVQPFIENHPTIAPITNGGLASLRIVTGMAEGDKAEFIASLLSLPYGDQETSATGIYCGVERRTGRIWLAEARGMPVIQHPDTGAPVVGIVLPFWREGIELVQRAHASAFPLFAFLGWDIALTKDGPILLESNSGWGALFHQVVDGPIGHSAFSRLVSQYV